jgi:hypothetical protein
MSRAVHIDKPDMVDLASSSSSQKKECSSSMPYVNSISLINEDVVLASIEGMVDDRAWCDPIRKLQKRSFRRQVLKDRSNFARNVSALGSLSQYRR